MRYLEFKIYQHGTMFFQQPLVRRVVFYDKPDSDGCRGRVVYAGKDDFFFTNTLEEVREILKEPTQGLKIQTTKEAE